jgi:hypothetical protein
MMKSKLPQSQQPLAIDLPLTSSPPVLAAPTDPRCVADRRSRGNEISARGSCTKRCTRYDIISWFSSPSHCPSSSFRSPKWRVPCRLVPRTCPFRGCLDGHARFKDGEVSGVLVRWRSPSLLKFVSCWSPAVLGRRAESTARERKT